MAFGVLLSERNIFSYWKQIQCMVYNNQSLFWERKKFLPGTVSMYGIGHSEYCCQKEKILLSFSLM